MPTLMPNISSMEGIFFVNLIYLSSPKICLPIQKYIREKSANTYVFLHFFLYILYLLIKLFLMQNNGDKFKVTGHFYLANTTLS